MGRRQSTPGYDQTAIRRPSEGHKSALNLGGVAQVDRNHLNPERWCHSLGSGPLTDPSADGGVANNGYSCHGRYDLFKQFQPFRADPIIKQREARGIAARPSQAVDKTCTNRIRHMHEDDWDVAGRL